MIRRIFSLLSTSFTLLVVFTVAQAQNGANLCPALVEQALERVDENCESLGQNRVCYGYDRIDALFVDAVDDTFFTVPSDRAELTELESIHTAALDVEEDRWASL
jgi:hypothetical protein